MLAILYDIHGNLPALEAVLDDAEAQGARRYLLGGDYAAFGAWPVECVETLEALTDATMIRGNWERWQGDPSAAPHTEVVQGAAAAVVEALGPDVVSRLAALPASVSFDDTLFCHASPISDVEPFPVSADAEEEDQLLAGVGEHRVVFGHTHIQFSRATTRGVELVNAGSVGLPWDGDRRAAYALLDDDGSGVHLRRVEYDVEAAAAPLDAIGKPWAATTAKRLREARFEV